MAHEMTLLVVTIWSALVVAGTVVVALWNQARLDRKQDAGWLASRREDREWAQLMKEAICESRDRTHIVQTTPDLLFVCEVLPGRFQSLPSIVVCGIPGAVDVTPEIDNFLAALCTQAEAMCDTIRPPRMLAS